MGRYKLEAKKDEGKWKLAILKPVGETHELEGFVREKGRGEDSTFISRDAARASRKKVRFHDTMAGGRLKSRDFWFDPEPQPAAAE